MMLETINNRHQETSEAQSESAYVPPLDPKAKEKLEKLISESTQKSLGGMNG